MTSEWMKVMLDEIARKQFEAEQARIEEQARSDAAAAQARPQRGCDTVG
jgi:hypothetical protein